MEIRHLRYFLAVADELSFTKAAEKLDMAQPPLSQQIRQLETLLGFDLFDRSAKHIVLTQAGREFYPEAKKIIDDLLKLEQRAALMSQGRMGHLRIGLITALATSQLALLFRRFQKAYPDLQLTITDRTSAWQLDALEKGKIDIGFFSLPPDLPATLQVHRTQKEALKLAVPSLHPLLQKKQLNWSDLASEPVILIDPSTVATTYYSGFYEQCRKNGFEPKIQHHSANVATQFWMVSAGLGVAPVVISDVTSRFPGVEFLSLPDNAPIYELAMVSRKSDASKALQVFVDFSETAEQILS
jgi:DNA-binding transcriptional LysR family regulator